MQVTPKYDPPESYQGYVAKTVNPHLDDYTHVILVDADMIVPKEFYDLPRLHPMEDIIAPKVVPTSRIFRVWETLTYGVRFDRQRLRGSVVIYSTSFLKKVGGYPTVESPDTWLFNHADKVLQVPLKAYHKEGFDLRHSIYTQVRSGKARAEMRQPAWRVVVHSIFRLRPVVLITYLRHRKRLKS